MVLLQFLIVFCLPLISLGSIDESTDINKSKKIQIVYIKVPLVTNKLRNNQNGNPGNNLINDQPNGDKSSYSMSQGNSGKQSYMSNSGYNGPSQTGSGYIPNYDYPSNGLNNQGSSSYSQSGSFSPYTSSSNSFNDVSGNNKKPLFSSSSSPSYDQSLPHPNSIVSPSPDSPVKQKPAFPFPLNLNGPSNSGYSGRGININNGQTRPTGFQGFDKNYNQDQRFNQGPINLNNNQHNNNNNHVINPVNVNTNNMNNPSGNANFAFNYGNNYDKGQPFNGPSLPLGLMGSSNGFMGNLKPSDGFGHSNGLIKPMGSTGKLMKPGNFDDGLGSAYGAASTDPLPYGSNEAGDSIGPSYNPSDFFGPSATSLDSGLDDFTGFGDMTFDNDALLNFGGMQPFTGDLGMEANKKKNKGYGSFMSSALSGLGSFGLLSGGGSSASNGLTSNYNPVKGMAVAMSNTFPSFTGPKPQGPNHGQSGSSSSSGGSSSGFGGIRTRLTNLLTGRLPSLNFASLTGLGSLGGPSGMTGLGGMNSGLLGLFGL